MYFAPLNYILVSILNTNFKFKENVFDQKDLVKEIKPLGSDFYPNDLTNRLSESFKLKEWWCFTYC